MSSPNVLLVVFDTARADAFEPYGAPAGATPVIADLARGGVHATDAFAPCNWTLPSHASMFTGLLPGALGLTSAQSPAAKEMMSRSALERVRDRVLAEVLRTNGYATAAISANPWIHEVNGFSIGFERFVDVHGRPRRQRGSGVGAKAAWTLDALAARADDGAEAAERLLREWLAARDGRPFFWFVNLMECHSPYLPPRPYNSLAPLQRVRAARDAARYLTIEAMYRYSLGQSEIPGAAIARMRRLYADSVRVMDGWLGRVMEAFDHAGILDDTVVVVTADHGENLGENHLISHIVSLDDRLLRVPLIARGPQLPALNGLMSLAELPTMLAGACGLQQHPWVDDVRPEGLAVAQASTESLLPVLEELVRGWGVTDETVRAIARTMTCATDGTFKLVRDADGERVYRPATDRLETAPLDPGDADPALIGRLRAAVDAAEAATVAAPEAAPAAIAGDEAAELEERMRQLGYL